MEDIRFPGWVIKSAAFSMAAVLGRAFRDVQLRDIQLASSPDWIPSTHDVSGRRKYVWRSSDSVNLMAIPADTQSVLSESCAEDGKLASPRHSDADMIASSSKGIHTWLQHRPASLFKTNGADWTHSDNPVNASPLPMVDVLHNRHVRHLFSISHINEIATEREVRVSTKNAVALVALMALAVECLYLPSDCTKGFYTECSALYTAFLQRLPHLQFTTGMDVNGFVASIVACTLKLRQSDESATTAFGSNAGSFAISEIAYGTSPYISKGRAHRMSQNALGNVRISSRNVGLSGFDSRIIDSIIISCIPEDIDACVADPIALGILEGLTFTFSRKAVYLSPHLVMHLHKLIDAFANSPHRRQLPYKKLLALLLGCISCSHASDRESVNCWIATIIQEDYVVRGLFQREVFHAHAVGAALKLLIQQYQEVASEYAIMQEGIESAPDFTGADQLIDMVWKALHAALSSWEVPEKSHLTLFSANIHVLVGALLQTEVERQKCYNIVSILQQRARIRNMQKSMSQLPNHVMLVSTGTTTALPLSTRSGTPQGEIAASRARVNSTTSAETDDTSIPYVPSMKEEALRLQIVTNITKFLLLPTSIINALPPMEATELRRMLSEECAKVLTLTMDVNLSAAMRAIFSSPAPQLGDSQSPDCQEGAASFALHTGVSQSQSTRQKARYSAQYYRQIESCVQEIVHTELEKARRGLSDNTTATGGMCAQGDRAHGISTSLVTLCLQSMCAADPYVRSFSFSEVMDAVIRIPTLYHKDPGVDAASREADTRQLALCFEMLRGIVVPQGQSLDAPLSRADLPRYSHLLCITYEDALRDVMATPTSQMGAGSFPSRTALVAAASLWKLALLFHKRLYSLTRAAFRAVSLTYGDHREDATSVHMLNGERWGIRLLLRTILRTMLNIAWPGSGILYQKPDGCGEKPIDDTTAPEMVAPLALAALSPFFRTLSLLCSLSTLFPVQQLEDLAGYNEYGQQLVSSEKEPFGCRFYFNPRNLLALDGKDEDSYQFRSCWMMLGHYGFTGEALNTAYQEFPSEPGDRKDASRSKGSVERRVLAEEHVRWIRRLATSAAPLLRMRSSDMQQTMADTAVLLRYVYPPTDATATSGSLHTQLLRSMRCFHAKQRRMKGLSVGELFLVRCIMELELLRATSCSIAALPLYQHFDIREFVASPALQKALVDATGVVCTQYLRATAAATSDIAYATLERETHHLTLMFCFSVASVRNAANMILRRILHAFPAYAAYSSSLPLLWTVTNLISSGNSADVERFCARVNFYDAPAMAAGPESIDWQAHLKELVLFAKFWAERSWEGAPLALCESAMHFVVGNEMSEGVIRGGQRVGSQLAADAAQLGACHVVKQDGNMGVCGLTTGAAEVSSYAHALIKRSNALGAVLTSVNISPFSSVERNTLSLLQKEFHLLLPLRGISEDSSFGRLKEQQWVLRGDLEGKPEDGRVSEAITSYFHRGFSQHDGSVVPSRLHELDASLCSAVALLCTGRTSPMPTVELLRYLVWGPIHIFDSDHLSVAVQAWKWLLTSNRGAFAIPLLLQLAEGLRWTAARQIGLFDGARPSQEKEVQSGDRTTATRCMALYAADYDCKSPHKILFAFLGDIFVSRSSPFVYNSTVLRVLHGVATSLMQHPSRLSLKDASFAETMRCMLVIGRLCQNLQTANAQCLRVGAAPTVPSPCVGLLRQRWYRCFLQWFSKTPPSWYFANDTTLLEEEAKVVYELVELLKEESGMLRRSAVCFLDFSMNVCQSNGETTRIWCMSSAARLALRHVAAQEKMEESLCRLIKDEQTRLLSLLDLLRELTQHELVRLRLWHQPRRAFTLCTSSITAATWRRLCDTAADHDPAVLVAMASRFSSSTEVRHCVSAHVVRSPERFCHCPDAVALYLTDEVLRAGATHLSLFGNCTIVQALRLLDERYASYPHVTRFAIRSLMTQKSDHLIFYLPQLLQVLATDGSGGIESFLQRMCRKSIMFCHQLLWSLHTLGEGKTVLANKCAKLEDVIKSTFTPRQHAFYENEFQYIDLLISVSGALKLVEKAQRKEKLRARLVDRAFHVPVAENHIYLPTNPECRVVGVIPHTAGAMQSAAKCPILVQFKCVDRCAEDMDVCEGGDVKTTGVAEGEKAPLVKACIFKMGDDCRQDQIALQLIDLFQRILNAVGVPSFLYPYRVVTTGQESGIIECVPHSKSRNEIGKLVESNLAEYFVQTYGHPESVGFRRARDAFIKSMASYSVASFILNIKDRHNGNLMVDAEGHLIHIDFGFLFDISPGGDINFESSPFKLTVEMVQLIGHDVGKKSKLHSKLLAKALVDEESYIYFKTLVLRCFLAVRGYAREICDLVGLMLRSGLPCFKPQKTIADLAQRLALHKTEIEAAEFMRRRIHESRENYRTVLYDAYQSIAEGIEM